MYFKVNSWMFANRKIKPFREGNEHTDRHKNIVLLNEHVLAREQLSKHRDS